MKRPENKTEIEAFRWALLVEKGTPSAELQNELDSWLTASTLHQGAYARARAMLLHLDRLGALAGASYLPEPPVSSRVTRRMVLAASLSAIGLIGASGWLASDWISKASGDARYMTDIGELRTVRLPDGTVMTLNTATEACVKYRRAQREVRLTRGEVLFEVAHESRPFLVRVGELTVRAVGTAFAVRREILRGESTVTVTEGTVQILPLARATKPSIAQLLAADQEALLTEDSIVAVQVVPPAEVARRLAWRRGMLIFNGQSLQAAISELNRYTHHEVVVTDDRLAVRPVLGVFRTTDTQTFLASVEFTLGARAVNTANGKVLILPTSASTQ